MALECKKEPSQNVTVPQFISLAWAAEALGAYNPALVRRLLFRGMERLSGASLIYRTFASLLSISFIMG